MKRFSPQMVSTFTVITLINFLTRIFLLYRCSWTSTSKYHWRHWATCLASVTMVGELQTIKIDDCYCRCSIYSFVIASSVVTITSKIGLPFFSLFFVFFCFCCFVSRLHWFKHIFSFIFIISTFPHNIDYYNLWIILKSKINFLMTWNFWGRI